MKKPRISRLNLHLMTSEHASVTRVLSRYRICKSFKSEEEHRIWFSLQNILSCLYVHTSSLTYINHIEQNFSDFTDKNKQDSARYLITKEKKYCVQIYIWAFFFYPFCPCQQANLRLGTNVLNSLKLNTTESGQIQNFMPFASKEGRK